MTRIKLEDTTMSMCMKMCEGNPGALNVCVRLLNEAPEVDTDDIMGGLGTFLMMDTVGIYGARIWMLYKDVCKEELWKMVAVIRGCQLGFISQEDLLHAIENYGEGINVSECIEKVTAQLKGFKIPEEN